MINIVLLSESQSDIYEIYSMFYVMSDQCRNQESWVGGGSCGFGVSRIEPLCSPACRNN